MIETNKNISLRLIVVTIFTLLIFLIFQKVQQSYYFPVSLAIELRSEKNENCQIFYKGFRNYSESRSMRMAYDSVGDFQLANFPLPAVNIRGLRIDPGYQSEWYKIRQIVIKVGDQRKSFSGNELGEHFQFINLQISDSSKDDLLMVEQLNSSDGQLILKNQLSDYFTLEKQSAMKNFWLAVIGLIYLLGLFVIIRFGQKIISWFFNNTTLNSLPRFIDEQGNIFKRYLIKNQKVFILFFLIATVSYGYELFNFSLSIDEEMVSFTKAKNEYIYLLVGRWGVFFVSQLFSPESVLPYYPFLITLVCLSISGVLFITRESSSLSAKIIFGLLFISHPVHAYYLTFNTVNLYYGMGMVLSTVSYLLFVESTKVPRYRWWYFASSTIILTIALSLYQAMIAFFLVFAVYHIFNLHFNDRKILWQKVFVYLTRLIAVLISSVILYKIVDIIARYSVLGSASNEQLAYINDLFEWGKKPVNEIIMELIRFIAGWISGWSAYQNFLGISSKSILVLFVIMFYYVINMPGSISSKLFKILCLGALLLSSFSLVLLNGMPLPYRTMMAFPLMIGILWWFTYRQSGSILRKIMLLVALVLAINNTYTNTRLFYSSQVVWQADRDMANRIVERIYNLDPPLINGKLKVVFIGHYGYSKNELFIRSGMHGASFFDWDSGNPQRMVALFKTIGINEIQLISTDEFNNIGNQVDQMPCWPEKCSVALINDIVVVKFSE
jgi:hypothetical protein